MALMREVGRTQQTRKCSKGKMTRRHVGTISPLASLSSSCPSSSSSSPMIHHDYHRDRSHNSSSTSFSEETTSSSSTFAASKKRGSSASLAWWWACLLTSAAILLSSSSCGQVEAKHAWERPGCHKVGHTRKVTIPECVEFTITTNACRGYCESFAVPSAWYRLQNNPSQAITSVGQCCNIMETEDVTVNVMCVEGQKELVFKSAKSCACYHCKKD